MRFNFCAAVVLISSFAVAQVASHAPTGVKSAAPPPASVPSDSKATMPSVSGKTVARVNGAALTDRDLVREMFAIFPYARQHNGFPAKLEPEIRRGALDMIIFEELVYQEAKRRNMTIPPERIAKAEAAFKKQFTSDAIFEGYLKAEMNGSKAVLRERIRRSLLIEALLTQDILNKSVISTEQAKAYYDKNPKDFDRPEMISIQSISILPPKDGGAAVQKEARTKADEAYKQAKNAKNYNEFGLLAEKLSDDDYHVNMGDHHAVPASQLPPEIVKAASNMKPGQVSELIQLGTAYTIFRLVAHTPAGKVPFAEVKTQLQSELQKQKVQQLRSALGERLRKTAKIEKL